MNAPLLVENRQFAVSFSRVHDNFIATVIHRAGFGVVNVHADGHLGLLDDRAEHVENL